MPLVSVDESLCTGCGQCVADCPRLILELTEDGFAAMNMDKQENCFDCRHCLAICPTGALNISSVDLDDCIPLKDAYPTQEQMEALVKGRRSFRSYRPEPLDREVIDHLLTVASNAPTGVNTLQTLLTVVYEPGHMDTFRHTAMEAVRSAVESGSLPPGLEFFEGLLKAWDKGRDVIFRGSPHFIVASSPAAGPSAEADCLIFLSYFELLAQSMGIGTLWNGLAKWTILSIAPELRKVLGIPAEHTVGYCMTFGLTDLQYQRSVERGCLAVNEVSF